MASVVCAALAVLSLGGCGAVDRAIAWSGGERKPCDELSDKVKKAVDKAGSVHIHTWTSGSFEGESQLETSFGRHGTDIHQRSHSGYHKNEAIVLGDQAYFRLDYVGLLSVGVLKETFPSEAQYQKYNDFWVDMKNPDRPADMGPIHTYTYESWRAMNPFGDIRLVPTPGACSVQEMVDGKLRAYSHDTGEYVVVEAAPSYLPVEGLLYDKGNREARNGEIDRLRLKYSQWGSVKPISAPDSGYVLSVNSVLASL